MTQTWNLTLKPSFVNELMALPPKAALQVQNKLHVLMEDPAADAKTKKKLKAWDGRMHRLRSGDFRVFYTYEYPYVSVLAVRAKHNRTYDEHIPTEDLGGGEIEDLDEVDDDELVEDTGSPEGSWDRWLGAKSAPASSGESLKLDPELLDRLRVPPEHRAAITSAHTVDELLDRESIPEPIRLRVYDALVGRSLHERQAEPDLLLESPDDLIRYHEGELLGFLLKLDPEQEKFVDWAMNAKGPTLLKGGPGTGKSTVALYRARSLIGALRKKGVERPRILFTTYTNALVRFSEQLLRSLLGEDADLVEVRTADSVAVGLYTKAHGKPTIFQGRELEDALEHAIREARFVGNSLVQAAQRQTVEKLGRDYLREEIEGVISGRGYTTLDEYRDAARPGRRVPLNKTQREAVWRVHEALLRRLGSSGVTWPQVRAAAAQAATPADAYDAVIVDEAQDLDPMALRMLVALCKEPNRLFLAADANQSIYGAGFRWNDVHDWLRFQGRTGVLKANHRSTREIGEAAQHYLGGGELDDERERGYVHSGPLPAVRAVASWSDEAKLIARFFRGASRELHLGLGSCAVLCPTNAGAKRVAEALQEEGMTARFVEPRDLDLSAPGIKTLTLKSAKGLEFPIVAIGGTGTKYPYFPNGASDEERQEILDRERRTMFVAMTRAMRALLVVTPTEGGSELMHGFAPTLWNLGGNA